MAENVNYIIVTGSDALPGTYREYIGVYDAENMPTDCGNFSLFFDVDVNKVYFYIDSEGWMLVGGDGGSDDSGGGNSGGGDSGGGK